MGERERFWVKERKRRAGQKGENDRGSLEFITAAVDGEREERGRKNEKERKRKKKKKKSIGPLGRLLKAI